MKIGFLLPGLISIYILTVTYCDALQRGGVCSRVYHPNTYCLRSNFLCRNGKCISRDLFHNGRDDCGDNSDENQPYMASQCSSSTIFCEHYYGNYRRCVPTAWLCDGVSDCPKSDDEINCNSLGNDNLIRNRTLHWITGQKNPQLITRNWRYFVDKSAVALYLSDDKFASKGSKVMKEMGYEVSIHLLSKLLKKKLGEIPSEDIASYINAFLVTCVNPRKFHGMDLVRELRSRVEDQNYTVPYVLLSLCNAGETVTQIDTTKLVDAFWSPRRIFWTDVQAYVVMALVCAMKQPWNYVDSDTLQEMVKELKRHQYSNGTVENLQTTALVLQALLSADPNPDPKTFDETQALQQIYDMQQPDGSFGSLLDTYYVLPILFCKSLVNVSSEHCQSSNIDEVSALENLRIRSGPQIRVRYSLWIGHENSDKNVVLRVPANASFYATMEMAAEVDSRYRFEYVMKNGKPYVNAISGIKDNPEKNKFWFLYTVHDGNPVPSQESPVDVVPKDRQHFIMWYRRGTWVE